jgi:hypothetical protein
MHNSRSQLVLHVQLERTFPPLQPQRDPSQEEGISPHQTFLTARPTSTGSLNIMENSSPVWHSRKDISDHTAYELLKQVLTPTTSKSTDSGQKPKQERAVLTAVVGDITCSSKKILLMGSSKERMRRIRQNRAKIAELNASADEFTLEVQKDMANVYLQFPPDHVNKLNADMALLLVQFTQRWCDKDFMAALNGGKTRRVYSVIEPD